MIDLAYEAHIEDDDKYGWDETRHGCVDTCHHHHHDIVIPRLRQADRHEAEVDDIVRKDRVGVDDAGEQYERNDDHLSSTLRAECVTAMWVKDLDVAFQGEGDDAPR